MHYKIARMGKTRLGRRTLRVLRAERDLTQHATAAPAGLTPTRYWQIEHGSGAAARPEERQAIARVLGVRPDAIAWPAVVQTALQRRRAQLRAARQQGQAAAWAPLPAPLGRTPATR